MKRFLCMAVVLLLVFCFTPVFAQETGEGGWQDDSQTYTEMLESSGAGGLMEEAPDKTQELLEEYGISSLDPQSILRLKPGDLASLLWEPVCRAAESAASDNQLCAGSGHFVCPSGKYAGRFCTVHYARGIFRRIHALYCRDCRGPSDKMYYGVRQYDSKYL